MIKADNSAKGCGYTRDQGVEVSSACDTPRERQNSLINFVRGGSHSADHTRLRFRAGIRREVLCTPGCGATPNFGSCYVACQLCTDLRR